MKKQTIYLFFMSRVMVPLCICCTTFTIAHAQIVRKPVAINSEKLKQSQMVNVPPPAMLSPVDNTDFSKPVNFMGTALAGAMVTIHITPMSQGGDKPRQIVVIGSQNPYYPQNYTVTANDKGVWGLPNITIKFPDNSRQRRIQVLTGQQVGNSSSQPRVKEFKLPDNLKIMVAGTMNTSKKYTLSIHLNSIETDHPKQAVKLGLSQWTDVYVNGQTINNQTNESQEVVCWWLGVCQQPRVFAGHTNMDSGRTFSISASDINNNANPAYLDIWTKYIASYSMQKIDLVNVIAPQTIFNKKTKHLENDKGIQHDHVLVKDVIACSNSTMEKTIFVNFDDWTYSMNYTITAKAQ